MILNSKKIVLLVVVLVVCIPLGVFAQPGFDPGMTDGPGGPGGGGGGAGAPIDGGLSMLAVAGVAYGVKKLDKRRKENIKSN